MNPITINLKRFAEVYQEELTKAVIEYPEEYRWPVEQVPTVAAKMIAAVVARSYNKDGRAFKATCKRLGIKYTYAAIADYIKR